MPSGSSRRPGSRSTWLWKLAVGADLALPWIEAPRPLSIRLINAYIQRLLRAAEHDPVLSARFMEVSAFMAKPPQLMTPAMVARVIAGNRRARHPPRSGSSHGRTRDIAVHQTNPTL